MKTIKFITYKNTIINLQNVSTIKIDEAKNRLIFNLNYSIQVNLFNAMTNKTTKKLQADYIYCDFESANELQGFIKLNIETNDYVNDTFLNFNDKKLFINKNSICSIKKDESHNRIIFNLNNIISFKDVNRNIANTSDFIYIDSENTEELTKTFNYVLLNCH